MVLRNSIEQTLYKLKWELNIQRTSYLKKTYLLEKIKILEAFMRKNKHLNN